MPGGGGAGWLGGGGLWGGRGRKFGEREGYLSHAGEEKIPGIVSTKWEEDGWRDVLCIGGKTLLRGSTGMEEVT